MTRKDYIKIAEIFKNRVKDMDHKEILIAKILASDLARIFYNDNPSFDHDRFYTACQFSE